MENDQAGYDQADMRHRFARIAGRHENGTAPRAVVAHQLFQTPVAVAAQLVALLGLKPGERVLEPSAGLGRLLDAIPRDCETVAVDISAACTAELYRDNRDVRILQRDFLDVDPGELGLFDAVAMNPPFTMRADIRHIQHALTFLKRGGRLAALCFDTEHRRHAFQRIAAQWITLPDGSFKEAGTGVPVAMMLLEGGAA